MTSTHRAVGIVNEVLVVVIKNDEVIICIFQGPNFPDEVCSDNL